MEKVHVLFFTIRTSLIIFTSKENPIYVKIYLYEHIAEQGFWSEILILFFTAILHTSSLCSAHTFFLNSEKKESQKKQFVLTRKLN